MCGGWAWETTSADRQTDRQTDTLRSLFFTLHYKQHHKAQLHIEQAMQQVDRWRNLARAKGFVSCRQHPLQLPYVPNHVGNGAFLLPPQGLARRRWRNHPKGPPFAVSRGRATLAWPGTEASQNERQLHIVGQLTVRAHPGKRPSSSCL